MGKFLKQSKSVFSGLSSISVLSVGAALVTAEAAKAQDDAGVSFSANAALVSDYRFRGVSLSDKDPAIQGGFDVGHESGFYVGTWGSSIENFGGSETEIDLYAGFGGSFGDLSTDIGIIAYTYPGSDNTHYWEIYGSLGGAVGVTEWTFGAAYVWDQSNVGNDDNIYIYADGSAPIGDTPLSFSGHVGFEDGAFGSDKWDWSAGVSMDFNQFSVSVAYVDTNIENSRTAKGGVVATLSASF